MRDGWRLAVGTLTALPSRPPSVVDAGVARSATLLAPLAFLPVGFAVAAWAWIGTAADLPALVVGLGVVTVLALATRVLHWDGLSDVADGLTASYDRERSLEVMKSGASGPAGVVAVVLVAGLQAAGAAGVLAHTSSLRGAVLLGVLACLARWGLLAPCARPVRSARPGGLGDAFAGSVPVAAVGLAVVAGAAVLGAVGSWAGYDSWRGPVAVLLAGIVLAALVVRCSRRFGGVTGDVLGACIEVCFAVLVVGLAG